MKTLFTIIQIRFLPILVLIIFNSNLLFSQLIVTPATTQTKAEDLIKVLTGPGVTYSNVKWTGQFIYQGQLTGSQIGSFKTGSGTTNLGINNGIIMSTGDITRAGQSNVYPSSSKNFYDYYCICEANEHSDSKCINKFADCIYRDSNLEAILGCSSCTYDATALEFDFVPSSNQISFRYVFASDEYPEFVCNKTNDIFGLFVWGPKPGGGVYIYENIALIPNNKFPPETVTINSINSGSCSPRYPFPTLPGVDLTNGNFYVNNINGTSIVYNAFTKVFTAKLDVIPCNTYHIRFAIADVADGVYDSSVFIEAKNFLTPPPIITYSPPLVDTAAVKGCSDAIITINTFNGKGVLNDSIIQISFTGNAVYGSDYTTIPTGITISLTIPMGKDSVSFHIHPLRPGTQPGKDLIVNFNVIACNLISTYPIKIKDASPNAITGQVVYDNSVNTELNSVNLNLKNALGTSFGNTSTDNNGDYFFTSMPDGKYVIDASTVKSWGGGNAADALLINRKYIGIYNFTDALKLKAADVNADNNVNPTDALLINKRYIGLNKSFKAGDWLFKKDTIDIKSNCVIHNFKGICVGDVNGSYKPNH